MKINKFDTVKIYVLLFNINGEKVFENIVIFKTYLPINI
jgi:hypothetical protein